jgi:hypothetical protein
MTMKLIATQTTMFAIEHELFVAPASRRRILKLPTWRKVAGETPAPQNHASSSHLELSVVE